MQEKLIYTSSRIMLNGKEGKLVEDSEGYYEMPGGAFNCMNSAGEVYTDEGIDELFSSSHDFYRKLTKGKLFGEWGHPTPAPGESMDAYVERASNISDKHTCIFIKDVWNDRSAAKHFTKYNGINNDSVITFLRLKPHGILWETAERALKDPNVNIALSVRNLGIDRVYRGVTYVTVTEIISWDMVTEQGVGGSEKWGALKMENRKVEITPHILANLRNRLSKQQVRMENVSTVAKILEVGDRFFSNVSRAESPIYSQWK